jgi:hypothetical protein
MRNALAQAQQTLDRRESFDMAVHDGRAQLFYRFVVRITADFGSPIDRRS